MSDQQGATPGDDLSAWDSELVGAGYVRSRQDALAVILMVLGGAGLVVTCFAADLLAGFAALSVTVLITGVLLGLDR